MRTRNRIALLAALNKMTLKDFKSQEERDAAYALLNKLEEADVAETSAGKKRASKEKGKATPSVTTKEGAVLTGKPGEGIARKTAEEATVTSRPVETEDVL
jgi:hypothetical protein